MRIVCISDTHLTPEERPIRIPGGDILIHAGDGTKMGTTWEIRRWNAWLMTFRRSFKAVVVIAGNHDWLFEKNGMLARTLIDPHITYLQDSMAEVLGLKIYGSPWTPRFLDWAFNLDRGWPIRQKWNQIPEGIDILVTHGPASGNVGGLLSSRGGYWDHADDVGCADLRNAILRVQPKLHVCGHVHVGYGKYRLEETMIVNASTCNEAYEPVNPPIVVDL